MKTGIELIAEERQDEVEKHKVSIVYNVELSNIWQSQFSMYMAKKTYIEQLIETEKLRNTKQ